MPKIEFGWVAPMVGMRASGGVPLAMAQQETILPVVAESFGSLWVYDHFYGLERRSSPWLEGWTALTWLAARFPTLHVGTLVLGLGFRNPALLAKMAATLQLLSGGRLILGIGAGWREEEHRAYGYPFPSAGVRRAQLEEALTIIQRMWSEPAPSFQGEHFSIAEAYCDPLPSPPPPIMIGSTGEAILPLIARRADWWDCWYWTADSLDPVGYAARAAKLDAAAQAAGRDPATIRRSVSTTGARLPQSAEEAAAWVERLRPFITAGATHFMLDFGPVLDADPIRRFADAVIAPLNAGTGG